jgi:hypothetical protein
MKNEFKSQISMLLKNISRINLYILFENIENKYTANNFSISPNVKELPLMDLPKKLI